MCFLSRRRTVLGAGLVLLALLLLGQRPVASRSSFDSQASSPAEALASDEPEVSLETAQAVDCTATACTGGPSGLDKCVERTKFCVFYTTASISATEAEQAADWVEDYWDRFTDLGFNEPKYSGRLVVKLSDITDDCNGGTGWSSNAISTYAGCFDSDLMAQATLGHELTHRVQYAHDSGTGAPIQTKFLKEGTARASEDNWFTNIDHRTDALTADFSFNKEVNNYLVATNNDITSYGMRYKSCLWWKYGTEQYGVTLTEPERGLDFFLHVYQQNTTGYSGIAAVNRALSAMGTGTNFDESFKQFAVANWTKDLSGLPNASYNYLDEDETGNPAPYGPLVPEPGGTISVGSPANWYNQNVARYGLRYYEADVDPGCPLVSVSFHRDLSGPAFYHIITQDGSTFKTHVRGSGADWTQAFLNDGITKVVAIAGSLDGSSWVDLTIECADPVIDIVLPNNSAQAYVEAGSKFLAQVQVTDGSPTGPVVAGLTNSDFGATVDGDAATVAGGGFIQEQYWLVLEAPPLPDGTAYDLEVTLEAPGSGPPAASDTNADSVFYTADRLDQVLVIDRSGSMDHGSNPRLPAAQAAASFYVDVTRDGDGLAVVPYHTDVDPAPFDLREVVSPPPSPGTRYEAKAYINALLGGNWTSIGDGLQEAVDQRTSSPTGNPHCSFVLLSDGMENEPDYWSDVRTDVIDTGCPVTTIAFGPESDETLMQQIATDTGGLYFYNDVYVSGPRSAPSAATPADVALELGGTYEYTEGRTEGRQRFLSERGLVSEKNPEAKHMVLVDTVEGSVAEAVFALDWYEQSYAELELQLFDPEGNLYGEPYTFEDAINRHVGYRIEKPMIGWWTMLVKWVNSEEPEVPYQVVAGGRSNLTLDLLLPDRLGTRYYTGNRVPIYALLTFDRPIPDADVNAWVTAPNGTVTLVPLYDDGEHDDGGARDGLYAGLYTAVNQASSVPPQGEEDQSEPKDEGGYRVLARATHPRFIREALGAFSVLEGPDANGNRLPDPWEREYGLGENPGAGDDPDLDLLTNWQEYQHGTNPLDSDTDDGGEKDGSEVQHVRDPLDPADDQVRRPDFLQVRPLNRGVLLQFDFKPVYSFVRLYRAMDPAGPWESMTLGIGMPPTGVYSDTQVENGTPYFYQLEGVILPGAPEVGEPAASFADEIVSGLIASEPVTPAEDPLPPEAEVSINGGAPSTPSLNVTLTFAPYESEGTSSLESFEDIESMKLSNDPSFAGAEWLPFEQGVPWRLEAERGETAQVFARFRDKAGNESIGPEVGMILYHPHVIHLPLVTREGG